MIIRLIMASLGAGIAIICIAAKKENNREKVAASAGIAMGIIYALFFLMVHM